MAELISTRVESQSIHPSYSIWPVLLTGLFIGVINWCLTFAISRYTNSTVISGNIASILSATFGTLMLLGLKSGRPLVITTASAVTLWGIVNIADGLVWYESLLWIAGLYSLAYLLFSWIARYLKIVPVVIAIIIIAAIVRMSITL